MNTDKWVMVRDDEADEWVPRILLRVMSVGELSRCMCLTKSGASSTSWSYMRLATAIELLPCLPGEWAGRAVLRVKEFMLAPDREVQTLAKAVDGAIDWGGTPEGRKVWAALYAALIHGTEIPECPPIKEPRIQGMTLTKEQTKEMLEAAKPLMLWISKCYPYCAATVEVNSVKLTESIARVITDELNCHPAPSDDKEVIDER